MTECSQSEFEFEALFSRRVVAGFDGGAMTSDGGALLLRQAERRLNLLPRLAECFLDARSPLLVKHPVPQLIAQRLYGLALGYEDLNDHEQLRQDPLLHVLAGKPEMDEPLAGKSTLNRLELSDGTPNRYKKITYWKDAIDSLFVTVFLEAFEQAPEEIGLDIDTTDVELHGGQEGRFFHGYYISLDVFNEESRWAVAMAARRPLSLLFRIPFSAVVILTKHYWVTSAKRRRSPQFQYSQPNSVHRKLRQHFKCPGLTPICNWR